MSFWMGTHGQTEGGEALSLLEQQDSTQISETGLQPQVSDAGRLQWYALWTHSH